MSAPNINNVTLVGRLTAEPLLRQLPDGRSVCDLRLAVNDLRRALGPGVRVLVVTRDPDEEDVVAVAGLAEVAGVDGSFDVVMSSQAYRDYGVGGPPFYALAIGSVVRTEGLAAAKVRLPHLVKPHHAVDPSLLL